MIASLAMFITPFIFHMPLMTLNPNPFYIMGFDQCMQLFPEFPV
jgi:hypothetical protein